MEAHQQASEHAEFLRQTYDPTKGSKDEQAEELARRRARAAFRLFLIDIFGAFDAVAELIAVFLPGELERLTLGKGMFTKHVYDWAARPLGASGIIISPARPFAERLHAYIRAEVVDDAVGGPWFDLLRAYRNKVTHVTCHALAHVACSRDPSPITRYNVLSNSSSIKHGTGGFR